MPPNPSRQSIHNILNTSSPLPTAMPQDTTHLRHSRKRTAAQISSSEPSSPDIPGPSTAKRRRSSTQRENATGSSKTAAINIEEIDLAGEGNVLQETLQRQRAEQVKAQAPQSDTPPKLATMTCVICMDVPTDLTATSCGHLFCHTCLIEALKAGERTRRPGEAKRSQCPVCRKNLDRNKPNDIIPLLIKQGKGGKRKTVGTT